MADINIENFYRHIGKALSMLYSAFPTKTPLYVDDVAGVDDPDEYGLHSPNYTSGFFALIWLADENFLRYSENIRQDGVDQAALTHKAFLMLTRIAEPIYEVPIYEEPGYSQTSNLEPAEITIINKINKVEKSRDVHLSVVEDSSPSIIEDQKLVINQLRLALKSGNSIAINKVVQYILQGA